MNETDYELSWIEKIMGGKLTTVEKSFCQVLFLLLLVWPVAAIILFKTALSGAEVLWVSNTIRLTMALFVLPYPIYLLPLLIFSRKIALHYKNPYLFYIIATVPFYIIICSNLLYISPLANARPKGADPFTYKDYGHRSYGWDKFRVYYAFEPLEGADVATFQVMEKNTDYATDKNHVYYRGYILKGAKPKTFVMVNDQIARDGKDYYTSGLPFCVSDYKSFRLKDEHWCIDKDYAYYIDTKVDFYGVLKVSLGDYKSFSPINDTYAHDSRQVYYKNKIIKGADAATFNLIKDYEPIGKDKSGIYYMDILTDVKDYDKLSTLTDASDFYKDNAGVYTRNLLKMPDGVDTLKLSYIDYLTDWITDTKNVYWRNQVVLGADPKSFAPLTSICLTEKVVYDNGTDTGDYGADLYHIFYRDKMLKDADLASFVYGWDSQAKIAFAYDKHRFYEGHSTPLIQKFRKGKLKNESEMERDYEEGYAH